MAALESSAAVWGLAVVTKKLLMCLVQKYNRYTCKFEMIPEDWVLRYNPFQNRHEFAPAGNGFSYLPTNGEFSAIPALPKYSPHQETFSPGERDWEPV